MEPGSEWQWRRGLLRGAALAIASVALFACGSQPIVFTGTGLYQAVPAGQYTVTWVSDCTNGGDEPNLYAKASEDAQGIPQQSVSIPPMSGQVVAIPATSDSLWQAGTVNQGNLQAIGTGVMPCPDERFTLTLTPVNH